MRRSSRLTSRRGSPATRCWWVATLITFLANRRKRAAHDYLAGMVVLRVD